MDLVFVRGRQLGLDHDGVLSPGLQRSDQVARLLLLPVFGGTGWWIHVRDQPAVGAASVLSIELSHIGIGSGRKGHKRHVERVS